MKMTIGILGPGAIGGFLAGLLWKQGHDVSCVCRPQTAAAIRSNGIQIESAVFENFVARPQADIKLAAPVDVLFIATKSPALLEALTSIAPELVEKSTIVSLLNGVGHREVIRASLGPHLAVGTLGMIEVGKGADGHIRQLSRQNPHIELASDRDLAPAALERVAAVMREAGVSTSILQSEAEVIWRKLVRLGAIASLTAAFQQTVGAIRSNPERRKLLEELVRDGAQVALHEGVTILPEEVLKQIDALPAGLTTSLQRDVHCRIPSEVESITGGVLRLARSCGISAPGYERAYELINQQIR